MVPPRAPSLVSGWEHAASRLPAGKARLPARSLLMSRTHEMSFARDVAQRVCFLDGGVILEEGIPEQIFGAPREPRTHQFLQRIVQAGRL